MRALVLTFVCLVAIAMWSWVRPIFFHGRSREAEARLNLKTALVAETAFWRDQGHPSTHVLELGFNPERGNRYAIYLEPSGPLTDRSSAPLPPIAPGAQGISTDTFKFPGGTAPTWAATGCPLTVLAKDGHRVGFGALAVPGLEVLFAAAGNTDADPDLDCWSIASVDRVDATGALVSAGEPYHERADRVPGLVERLLMRLR